MAKRKMLTKTQLRTELDRVITNTCKKATIDTTVLVLSELALGLVEELGDGLKEFKKVTKGKK